MKVRVLQNFRDKEHDLLLRKKGSTYDAEEKRVIYLENLGLVKRGKEASTDKT